MLYLLYLVVDYLQIFVLLLTTV